MSPAEKGGGIACRADEEQLRRVACVSCLIWLSKARTNIQRLFLEGKIRMRHGLSRRQSGKSIMLLKIDIRSSWTGR